jgi:transcriptional regulator GlxA family with amidase domain
MSSEGVGFGPIRLALRSDALAASGTPLAPDAARLVEHRRMPVPVPVRRVRARAGLAAHPVSVADLPATASGTEREVLARRLVERLLDALDSVPALSAERIAETIQCTLATQLNGFQATVAVPACRQAAGLGRAELVRITDYIDRNIDRGIALAELAALIKVSRFHFARLFKRSTGTTALAYVEARRIFHAQRLLVETDLPIAQVALMTGFADQSHFTRRFRERLGSTPAAFAREKGRRRSAQRAG